MDGRADFNIYNTNHKEGFFCRLNQRDRIITKVIGLEFDWEQGKIELTASENIVCQAVLVGFANHGSEKNAQSEAEIKAEAIALCRRFPIYLKK